MFKIHSPCVTALLMPGLLLTALSSSARAQQAHLTSPLRALTSSPQSVNGQVATAAQASSAVDFGKVNIGGTSSATLTFTFTSPGANVTVAALTLGAKNQDFVDAGTGSCTTNGTGHIYAAGDTCSVVVTFTPLFNGPRHGAVLLINGTIPVAQTYVSGIGYGPQLAYLPAAQSTIGHTFSGPNSVAVDGSGNIYVASIGLDSVEELMASDGSVRTLGSGFVLPGGVAVDGAGNVYVADTYNNAVKEIRATDGSVATLGSGFMFPNSVAVDSEGNVYVADIGNKAVKEIVAADGSVKTLGSGFNGPAGVAVDGAGNVYVACLDDGTVKEYFAATGKVQTLGTGFNLPRDVAVDGIGNVYVTDTYNNAVQEISVTDGSKRTVGNGFDIPNGVAVTSNGNVYIADYNHNRVVLEDFATAPVVNFPTPTNVVSLDTADGIMQTFVVENIGSAPLTLAPAAGGMNPALTAGFNLASGSATTCPTISTSPSATASLASNASCAYAVTFMPVTYGVIQGTLTLTDNNLSAYGTGVAGSQVIQLKGTAVGVPTIVVTGTAPVATAGASYAGSFAATGGVAPYAFTVAGLPPGLSLSASGSLTGTPTVAGSYTLILTATDSHGYTGSASFPLTVAASLLDFQFSSVGTQTQTILLGGAAQFAFSVSPASGSFPLPVTFTVSGIPANYCALFSPSTVIPGSNTVQTQVSLQSSVSEATAMSHTGVYGVMASFLLLPFLAVSGVRRRLHRSLFAALLIAAAVASTLGMSGCVGTQVNAAAYDVVVTATGNGHQHAVHVALTLRQ